ncbi:response regulator [Rhizorhabdus dicambivorans]|uniref:Response regulator n=1 Tax=Rhizorhabdus dicambivorans TaxID=1850238 RepID=A0A2A4FT34_9SPHN|nr:response regulator [Rhizorhabdus dicambivorans]ATE65428.1 response regulator [Rhizorhabdus dicambivorans]PCE40608.1 response regulator [Rhizorhabdus dicambivorans]
MEHILVVEDEMIVALDLEHILQAAGHQVVGIAPDMETALELAPACSMALVDVNLRDGPTGPGVGAEIFRRHGARIIFVTANPEQIGSAAGIAVGRVSKPFDSRAILSAIAIAQDEDLPDRLPDHAPAASLSGRLSR